MTKNLPNLGGVSGILLMLLMVIFSEVCPKLFNKLFPVDNSNRIEGDFETWLKKNNNRLFYVVRKVSKGDNTLTQFVDLYMYCDKGGNKELVKINYLIGSDVISTTQGEIFNKKNSNLYGTWKFTDFDIVDFSQKLNKLYGNVTLLRIDEDIVTV